MESDHAIFGVREGSNNDQFVAAGLLDGAEQWYSIYPPKPMRARDAFAHEGLQYEFDKAKPIAYKTVASGRVEIGGKVVQLPVGWWDIDELVGNRPGSDHFHIGTERQITLYNGKFVEVYDLQEIEADRSSLPPRAPEKIVDYEFDGKVLKSNSKQRLCGTLMTGSPWVLMTNAYPHPLPRLKEWNSLADWLQRVTHSSARFDQIGAHI